MLYKERRYLIDVTEVFRGISFEKKLRYTKLGFYVFLFIMVVFRLTLSAVYSFTEDDDLLHLFWFMRLRSALSTTLSLFSECVLENCDRFLLRPCLELAIQGFIM